MPKPFRQIVVKQSLALTFGHSRGDIDIIGIAGRSYRAFYTIPEVCDKKSEL